MKEAVENFLPIERELFFALNGSDSVFLDNLFWTFTGRYVWMLMLLCFVVIYFWKTPRPRREAILATVFLVVLFALCDQVSSGLFKPLFERYRPTHHPDFKDMVDIVNNYRGGRFGFISGHATNSFGLALFISLLFKNRWVTIPLFVWAVLNSYSRIYLGVHFISDIVAGAIVGSLLALLLYELYVQVRIRYLHVAQTQARLSFYPAKDGMLLGIICSAYILFILIFSPLLATLPH
jgi:undecaprenyl-diphosphatase